jgi:uncharacterized protein YjeT (DUF2065 family)
MDTIVLGKIIAPYLLVTGLGFLLSGKFYKRMTENTDKSDPVLINLSGMVHFLIGIAVVTNHFLWSDLLEIIISILGFAFLLKGTFMIALPSLTIKSSKASTKFLRISGIGYLIVGLAIGYMSYFA